MKHLFAVHVAELGVADSALFHRCKNVLRLKPGQQVLLFDDNHQALATIEAYSKKAVAVSLEGKKSLACIKPEIHWLLPLLKREAFEQALYSLCEMGVTSIYPVRTSKASRQWGTEKDFARARTIMIAAAEQAKQFVIPTIHPVGELLNWQKEESDRSTRLFFDPTGMPLKQMLESSLVGPIYGSVGPEGDLTVEEKSYVKEQGFVFCALTPTVLRAQQAVALGLGVLRSYLIDLPNGVE